MSKGCENVSFIVPLYDYSRSTCFNFAGGCLGIIGLAAGGIGESVGGR